MYINTFSNGRNGSAGFLVSFLVRSWFESAELGHPEKGYYTILYYTILYYTILYYTILYYTILYYTILYYTLLYYTMLYYTLLYCTILYYTILYYTILYYTILYYTILYYTILYYTILYYTILYYTILYYTILYYTILYYTTNSPEAALFFASMSHGEKILLKAELPFSKDPIQAPKYKPLSSAVLTIAPDGFLEIGRVLFVGVLILRTLRFRAYLRAPQVLETPIYHVLYTIYHIFSLYIYIYISHIYYIPYIYICIYIFGPPHVSETPITTGGQEPPEPLAGSDPRGTPWRRSSGRAS